jgi:hypothetical protein
MYGYGANRLSRELNGEPSVFTFGLLTEEVLALKIVIRREEP